MRIDLNEFLRTCTLPIGALIVLEIFWNLIGYSVDSLCWFLKFLILAWAGYRYYQGTLGRTSAHSGTGRRLSSIYLYARVCARFSYVCGIKFKSQTHSSF